MNWVQAYILPPSCVTVTFSMSAVCLKLLTFLCLGCTALSGSEKNGVVRRNVGESLTIQCRCPSSNQESLTLTKGIDDEPVYFQMKSSEKNVTAKNFKPRLQKHGVFPNFDILIRNLTSDDTGMYWCKCHSESDQMVKGKGSVLLLVSETSTKCDQSNKTLVLVSVVISAAVLSGIILAFLVWLFKTRSRRSTVKPGRINNNDVYEDMRGTIRR